MSPYDGHAHRQVLAAESDVEEWKRIVGLRKALP